MPSLFPDLEPRARVIAEAFVAEVQRQGFVGVDGRGTPSKAHIEEIAHGSRDYVQQVGERPDLLKKIIRDMRKENLIIASPRSCIKLARQESQWKERDDRSRYVTGEYADSIEH